MRRLVLLVAIAATLAAPASHAGAAECHGEEQSTWLGGQLVVQTVQVCSGGDAGGTSGTVTSDEVPITDAGLAPQCANQAALLGADPAAFCSAQDPAAPADPQDVTPAMVAAALAAVPIPASVLLVQPPNGRTLVNFATNFYTASAALDRTVRLLGQRVDLHIVPVRFGWRFGDGGSASSREPGAPYPRLDVTHTYLEKGRVAPSVDTTYTATFRVGGGPWRAVPGSVTIPGAPVPLDVVTATPTLVGFD